MLHGDLGSYTDCQKSAAMSCVCSWWSAQKVETTDCVVASLIGVLDAGSRDMGLG
jgi:hypothetical protein